MNEHKIVLSFKPKQFEAIVRMAQAAGANSVDVFVQQKLLSILDVNDSKPPMMNKPEQVSSSDFQQVTNELRRLHAELKAFVAESLAGTTTNAAVTSQAASANLANAANKQSTAFKPANDAANIADTSSTTSKPRKSRSKSANKDPLSELLGDQTSDQPTKPKSTKTTKKKQTGTEASASTEDEEVTDDDEVDVPLSLTDKTHQIKESSKKTEKQPVVPMEPPPLAQSSADNKPSSSDELSGIPPPKRHE